MYLRRKLQKAEAKAKKKAAEGKKWDCAWFKVSTFLWIYAMNYTCGNPKLNLLNRLDTPYIQNDGDDAVQC